MNNEFSSHKKNSAHVYILGAILIILIIFLVKGLLVPTKTATTSAKAVSTSETPDKNSYQAVFLINNQTYFGKLKVGKEHYILTDVFYLRSNPSLQDDSKQPEIKLIKFGNELHMPHDAIFINKASVLYWENIEDTGKIVEGINQFKENLNKPVEEKESEETNQE